MTKLASWIAACALALITAAAHAQQSPSNKIAAEALFDRGLALMQQGKLAEACAQLEESQALESGIGTMLYLAECYERLGRVASAWALFREASSAARAEGQNDRAQAGATRAAALEPRSPKLSVNVAATARVPGLEVARNGQPVAGSLYGVPVPIDPGPHHIDARVLRGESPGRSGSRSPKAQRAAVEVRARGRSCGRRERDTASTGRHGRELCIE